MEHKSFVEKSYKLYNNGKPFFSTNSKRLATSIYNKLAQTSDKIVLATPDSAVIRNQSLVLNHGINAYKHI